ncbi:hypothetical protein HHK36_018475 [Tetracentron sinense]|uniref:RNase H type-1 domain-containing protein n=1 Tax=Tetracentron sinense TaxID=13715 RepID=A0A834Z092_TETSI|nr:hypothetical protein HHK36_018475 [Tetracentron sinense]
MVQLQRKLGFSHQFLVPTVGYSGGLRVFWNDICQCDISSASPNVIEAQICLDMARGFWHLSMVYGSPQSHRRPPFWNFLHSRHSRTGPHLCFGDFNVILHPYENVGGDLPRGLGGAAAVGCDSDGQVLDFRVQVYECVPPIMAEAKAICLGINLALDCHWNNIIVESDSLSLILALTSSGGIFSVRGVYSDGGYEGFPSWFSEGVFLLCPSFVKWACTLAGFIFSFSVSAIYCEANAMVEEYVSVANLGGISDLQVLQVREEMSRERSRYLEAMVSISSSSLTIFGILRNLRWGLSAIYCDVNAMVEEYQQAVSVANFGGIRDVQVLYPRLGLKSSPQVYESLEHRLVVAEASKTHIL